MCHPMDSTSWNDWHAVEEFYIKENNYMVQAIKDLNLIQKPYLDKFCDNSQWWDSFEKLLPYFRRVEFAGGEPLMDPQHYKILDMLSIYGDRIEIKYATNLTMLGKNNRTVYDYWHKFRSIAVNVSIDGIFDSYEYIRTNAKYNILIDNIKKIQLIPNVSRIVGSVAVQVSNVLVLDQMIEYFLNELGVVFYTNIVKYPNVLSIQVLPEPLKKLAIARLKTVREKVHTFKYVIENPILKGITYTHIDGVINFLESNDKSELWNECIRYNTKLDLSRSSKGFFAVTPEFTLYQ